MKSVKTRLPEDKEAWVEEKSAEQSTIGYDDIGLLGLPVQDSDFNNSTEQTDQEL